MMQIVIDPIALDELAEAAKWYSTKSLIAAQNFQKEITEAFKYLQSTIIEHRKVFKEVRILFLKIFPYNIFYIKNEHEQKIFIIAILHNKRDSEFIKSRLEK